MAAACALLIGDAGQVNCSLPEQNAAPRKTSQQRPTFPAAFPLVPFVKTEAHCSWNMHAKGKEKWVRGDIGLGDENPMISFLDHAFDTWSDSEDHKIEVSVGDPKRRLPASAWINRGNRSSAAFYMDAPMRKLIGGATSLQIWKDGKPVFNTQLANTPSAAELDACTQKPGWDVDSE